eukprot:GEMP01001101.1.p1 GENE.GEMP01001101.1~~GEMP01001101.1.p1  ORF type:complete len:1338 (+),score=303.73 GEMP01001101.1:56-4069(+)
MGKTVEIKANHGRIWTTKLVANKEGLLSTFVGPSKGQKNSRAPFSCSAFNGTGEVFACGDKRGHLFLFYVARNRFSLVSKLEKPAQSVVFTKRKNEEVVAASGSTARVFDIDSHRLAATLDAHKHDIRAMEGCGFGAWFLTTSIEVCVLWDVKTWSKAKSMWAEKAHLVDARFVPPGGDICTSFKDFRVVLWSTANFQMRREFRVDALSEVMHRLAPTKRHICAAGSRSLVVWKHNGDLTHIAMMESPIVSMEVGEVREHRKLADALFMLHDDGKLQVVHLESLQILVTLSAARAIIHFAIDPSSLHLVGVLANGLINMWDFTATLAHERAELQHRTRMGVPEDMLIRALKHRDFPRAPLQEVQEAAEKEPSEDGPHKESVFPDTWASPSTPALLSSANLQAVEESSAVALVAAVDEVDKVQRKSRKYDEALGYNTMSAGGEASSRQSDAQADRRHEAPGRPERAADLFIAEATAGKSPPCDLSARVDLTDQTDQHNELGQSPFGTVWKCERGAEWENQNPNRYTAQGRMHIKPRTNEDGGRGRLGAKPPRLPKPPSRHAVGKSGAHNRAGESDASSVPAFASAPLPAEVERDIFAPLQKLYGIENRLSVKMLRTLLLRQGQYPDSHRCLIWRYLLQLPYNVEAFEALTSKGVYPRFSRLRSQFPDHSAKEYQRLEKLLSAFGYYSILFGELSFLPQFVFPFLNLFGRDLCLAFEVCLSVILNWCHGWFVFFPNPPASLLGRLDDAFCSADPALHVHLSRLTNVCDRILWPMLTSCMTEVLCKQDWCQLWDHLVTHYTEPELFFAAILSFLRILRSTLLKITHPEKLDHFLHTTQTVAMKLLIKDMYVLCKQHFGGGRFFPTMVTSILPVGPFDTPNCLPLSVGTYPHFSDYPRSIVDDEQEQIDRLRVYETHIVSFKNRVNDIEEVTQRMRDEEELFRLQQEELMKAAEERQRILSSEDKKLFRERTETDEMMFQRRLEAIKAMQNSTRSSILQQRELRLKENERIIEEMNRRQRDKAYDLQSRWKEESLLNLELETHTQLSGLVQQRRKEESSRSLRQQVAQSLKEQELNEELQKQVWRVDDEQQRVRLTQMKQQKIKALDEAQDEHQRREILMELRLKTLERQIALAGVARERALRRVVAEFELKEGEAEQLRQQNFEYKMEADRRDQEAVIRESQREEQKDAMVEHALLKTELSKFGSEVEAKEQRMQEDRETRMREAFEDHCKSIHEEMQEERAKDEDAIKEILCKIDESRKANAATNIEMYETDHYSEEVISEDDISEPSEREKELVLLIAKREAELAKVTASFWKLKTVFDKNDYNTPLSDSSSSEHASP